MTAIPYILEKLSSALDKDLGLKYLESKQASALERGIKAEAFSAFPADLRPIPDSVKKRRGPVGWIKTVLFWILMLHAWYLGSVGLCIAVFRGVNPAATTLMVYRKISYGWNISSPIPLPLKKVPAYIRSMLISVEDGKFYMHRGIDFEAFKRAREINARVGRPLYGGSTITMQVARSLFLVPVKSYLRKYLEVLAALELELLLTKPRILELYFGYAEWGKGVFGIERASHVNFRVSSSVLSRDRAARLVALLSSPIRYSPNTLENSPLLKERYRYLSTRFDPESPFIEKATGEPANQTADSAARLETNQPSAATLTAETATADNTASSSAEAKH